MPGAAVKSSFRSPGPQTASTLSICCRTALDTSRKLGFTWGAFPDRCFQPLRRTEGIAPGTWQTIPTVWARGIPRSSTSITRASRSASLGASRMIDGSAPSTAIRSSASANRTCFSSADPSSTSPSGIGRSWLGARSSGRTSNVVSPMWNCSPRATRNRPAGAISPVEEDRVPALLEPLDGEAVALPSEAGVPAGNLQVPGRGPVAEILALLAAKRHRPAR